MKKITLLSLMTALSLLCFSQQRGTGNARTMSFEEANRLNGTAQPTINGKPYSQYKAEVQAKEQAAKNNVAQQPQVPEQFRLDLNKKWSSPAPATAPKAETQKPVTVATAPAVQPVQNSTASTAPATLVIPPVVNIAVDAQQAVPAESPAKLGRPEALKAQPVQSEKPKGQQ